MLLSVFLLILFVILLAIIYTGFNLSLLVTNPKRSAVDKSLMEEAENGCISIDAYNKLPKEDFVISLISGYKLSCQWIYPKSPSNKAVIICHGYGHNRVGAIKYIDIYRDKGFNIIIYDHRNSGYNDSEFTTMGHFEKQDLRLVMDYITKKLGNNSYVGTHGESMGAATVLLNSCIDSRVKFVIADCPYADLKDQLAYRLKIEYKLPRFPILYVASLIAKLRAGFFFGDVSPIKDIEKHAELNNIPIMFVHGLADDYIPYEASQRLYQAKQGKKKLYLVENARHVESICVNKQKYIAEVRNFLELNNL